MTGVKEDISKAKKLLSHGVYVISTIHEGRETGKRFGLKTGRKTDKFERLDYETSVTGSPILKDCIAWLDCNVVSSHEAGDHTVFIGEVVSGGVKNEGASPLIYDRDTFFS